MASIRKNMTLGLAIVVLTVAGNGVHMAKSAMEATASAVRAEAALAGASDRDGSIRESMDWNDSWGSAKSAAGAMGGGVPSGWKAGEAPYSARVAEAVAHVRAGDTGSAMVAFATMAICLATLFAMGRAVAAPLARLSREVESMARGDLGEEVDPESLPSEFGSLARGLFRMRREMALSGNVGRHAHGQDGHGGHWDRA